MILVFSIVRYFCLSSQFMFYSITCFDILAQSMDVCMYVLSDGMSSSFQAITLEEKDSKGDKNPKDFILFFDHDYDVLSTIKDNTGRRIYTENMVFPTLEFPSDHGITSTVLRNGHGGPLRQDSTSNMRGNQS